MKLRFLSLIISLTSLTSISSAFAEETPASSSEAGAPIIEEVIVTGSLLPRGDFVSKAPIATISSTQFEMSNTVNVEQLINSMPQVVGGADRSSTFGQGIATANLRGLGENRTLVLVNSRRFVPTFPDGGTVDLNFIPVGLIDRVEILTGGASAAYGSDALAGVINFILKDAGDIQGWEVNAGGEITEEGDAEIFNFNLSNAGGFSSGKGSYLVHLDILERKPVSMLDRDLTKVSLVDSVNEQGTLGLQNGINRFPTTENAGIFFPPFDPRFPNGAFGVFDNDGDINLRGFINTPQGGRSEAFGLPDGTEDFGNLNGFAYLQLPQERESFKGRVSYDFGTFEGYADLYYSKSEMPFRWGGPFTGFPVNFGYTATVENNPYWSQAAKEYVSSIYQIWGSFIPQRVQYRDDNGNGIADTLRFPFLTRIFSRDIGPTENDRSFESVQFELGIKGEVSNTWGYEIFAQSGEVKSINDTGPLLDPRRIQQALLITGDGNCIDPSNGCVPINLWGDNIGTEAANFITYPSGSGRSTSNNEQNVVMATISGNTEGWFSLPGDPGPIGVVFGAEYREINALIDTPEIIEQQLFEGFASAPFSLDAGIHTRAIFGEALVPLVSGKPGIDFLELELGWRFAEHSQTGGDHTFKVALAYYPNPDVQLRVSYNKAMRAPAINELFSYQQTVGFAQDPCTVGLSQPTSVEDSSGRQIILERTPELAATCIATGVPEENLYDFNFKEFTPLRDLGGNPELLSEDARTFSLGAVWTPYSIAGLSLSVDYFDVSIENYIELTPVLANEIMRSCYDLAEGRGGIGSKACGAVGRDADGRLTSLFLGFQNLGLHEVSGWDLNLEYSFELFSGFIDLNYFATKLNKRTIEDDSFGEVNFKCLGVFNGDCDNLIDYPVFDFKHRLTAGWSKEKLDIQLVWKYTSSLKDGDDNTDYFREKLDDYSVLDLSGRYSISDDWTLTLGVKNLLDKKPQAIGSNSWELLQEDIPSITNTYTQYYDVFGRTMFLKASLML